MLTVDEAIRLLDRARQICGKDAALVLSLTDSEPPDTDVDDIVISNDGGNNHVEIRTARRDLKTPEAQTEGGKTKLLSGRARELANDLFDDDRGVACLEIKCGRKSCLQQEEERPLTRKERDAGWTQRPFGAYEHERLCTGCEVYWLVEVAAQRLHRLSCLLLRKEAIKKLDARLADERNRTLDKVRGEFNFPSAVEGFGAWSNPEQDAYVCAVFLETAAELPSLLVHLSVRFKPGTSEVAEAFV